MLGEVERAEPGPNYHQTNQESEIANSVDDECLIRGCTCGMSLDIKTDQQIAANTDQFPKDKDLEDVAGQHEPQHRKTEQRHKRKKLVEPARAVQMTAA